MQGKRLVEFWSRHVEAWRRSGQTQRAYCKQHKLKSHNLSYWHRKLGKPKLLPKLVPVVKEAESAITIEVPAGLKVTVSSRTDPAWLAIFLKRLA